MFGSFIHVTLLRSFLMNPVSSTEQFILRLYDMFDGWIDVGEPTTREEAEAQWNEATANGTRKVSYNDGDYYKVFPADTIMMDTPESRGR